jgi:tetratricopeptide (TPR) repeat protein
VLALDADHAGARNALCWAYGLDGEPELALPHCERAVALDPDGPARDSRGIVYAELGRTQEAIAEFEAYLAFLRSQGENDYKKYGPRREAWLGALRAGRDPFDSTTLDQLRAE